MHRICFFVCFVVCMSFVWLFCFCLLLAFGLISLFCFIRLNELFFCVVIFMCCDWSVCSLGLIVLYYVDVLDSYGCFVDYIDLFVRWFACLLLCCVLLAWFRLISFYVSAFCWLELCGWVVWWWLICGLIFVWFVACVLCFSLMFCFGFSFCLRFELVLVCVILALFAFGVRTLGLV